jgi:hypothetical protein
VWGPVERNPFHGAPIAAARRRGAIPSPPPEVVQAFTLTDGERLAELLREAGFEGVDLRAVPAPRAFPSLDEALRSAREFPTFVALLSPLGEDDRERAWGEIAGEWSRYATPTGLPLPGEQLVVSGGA